MDRNFSKKSEFTNVMHNLKLAKSEVSRKWLDAVDEGVDSQWEAQYDSYFSAMSGNQKFTRDNKEKGKAVFEDYFLRKLWTDTNAGIPKNDAKWNGVTINSAGAGGSLAWATRASCIWQAS